MMLIYLLKILMAPHFQNKLDYPSRFKFELDRDDCSFFILKVIILSYSLIIFHLQSDR